MLRILCNIISERINDDFFAYKPGNVLYFSKNNNACAAIMFTNTKPVITTLPLDPSKSNEDINYKHLYTKLFNDGLVEHYRMKPNKYREYYSTRKNT